MASPGQLVCAGKKVGRQEKRSPGFVLPHVHALVRARHLQRSRIPPEHHVSKRQGVRAASERCQRGERSIEQWAVRFDDSVNNRHVSTPEKRDGQRDADERRRASPEITQQPFHCSIMRRAEEFRD